MGSLERSASKTQRDQRLAQMKSSPSAFLGLDKDEIGICYMAEINLVMVGKNQLSKRIEAGIAHFEKQLD